MSSSPPYASLPSFSYKSNFSHRSTPTTTNPWLLTNIPFQIGIITSNEYSTPIANIEGDGYYNNLEEEECDVYHDYQNCNSNVHDNDDNDNNNNKNENDNEDSWTTTTYKYNKNNQNGGGLVLINIMEKIGRLVQGLNTVVGNVDGNGSNNEWNVMIGMGCKPFVVSIERDGEFLSLCVLIVCVICMNICE